MTLGSALGRAYTQIASSSDYSLRIAALRLELAPGKVIDTFAYNDRVPGLVLRLREGRQVSIDIRNDTDIDDIIHWHGLYVPSAADGATEEGSPMVERGGGTRRYTFTPKPVGTRWYHSHDVAGTDAGCSMPARHSCGSAEKAGRPCAAPQELGDGSYPIGVNPRHRLDTMARYRAAVERLRKLVGDAGRDPASVALAFRVHRHGPSAPAKADNGERLMFSGSNAEIIDDLRAMGELGVKAIDFNFADLTVDPMRQFHEEVVAKSCARNSG